MSKRTTAGHTIHEIDVNGDDPRWGCEPKEPHHFDPKANVKFFPVRPGKYKVRYVLLNFFSLSGWPKTFGEVVDIIGEKNLCLPDRSIVETIIDGYRKERKYCINVTGITAKWGFCPTWCSGVNWSWNRMYLFVSDCRECFIGDEFYIAVVDITPLPK